MKTRFPSQQKKVYCNIGNRQGLEGRSNTSNTSNRNTLETCD